MRNKSGVIVRALDGRSSRAPRRALNTLIGLLLTACLAAAAMLLPHRPAGPIVRDAAAPNARPSQPATFAICRGAHRINCVVDGDTAWIDGVKIRFADIDAPETHPPRCAREADLGERATRRLVMLMNQGAVDLIAIDRDADRYGRKLRIVSRDGRSLGGVLVGEGLARWYGSGRRAWC